MMQTKWTPLHRAAESGQTDAIGALVKAGADVNAQTLVRRHPLCTHVCTIGSHGVPIQVAAMHKVREWTVHDVHRSFSGMVLQYWKWCIEFVY